jgi:LPXTG-site transpeptidase (sortase) family protein
MGSPGSRRLQLILLSMVGASALLVAMLLATGSLSSDGISLTAITASVSGSAGKTTVSGTTSAAPKRVADSVEAFAKAHGNPPDATYGRIRIPAISVNAPLTYRAVANTASATMPEPSGPTDVAYYDMSKWPGLGGTPGAGHNAIFAGHVDLNRAIAYAGGAHYEGPAVFWSLDELKAGDTIEITVSGGTPLKYAVVSVKEIPASGDTDWSAIWSGNVKKDTVTLFTCGGNFDQDSHEYLNRVVVRAERVA